MAVSVPTGFRVRRVGFRAGTDEELAALHAVEVPIASERGSNRMPKAGLVLHRVRPEAAGPG